MEMGAPSHCQSLCQDPLPSSPSNFYSNSGLRHFTPVSQMTKTKLQDKRNFAKLVSGWVQTSVCLLARPRQALSNSYRVSFSMAFASPTDGTFQNKPHTAQSKMKQADCSQKPSSKGIPRAFILQLPPAKGLSDYRIWPGGFQSPPLFHFSLSQFSFHNSHQGSSGNEV